MKQYKTTIISLAVIIVAIAAFFIISSVIKKDDAAPEPSPSPSPFEEVSENIFDVTNVTDISRYECNIVDNIVLERDGSSWICTSYDDLTLENVNVSYSMNLVSKAVAVCVYEGDITGEILETYGISSSEYVKIVLKDGSVNTLRFGIQKPGTLSYFAVLEEKSKVYLITGNYRNNIIITKENLIHTKVFDFADTGKIRKIEVQKSGEVFMQLEASGSGEDRTWSMTYPLKRDGNDSHIEEIISSVTGVYCSEYIEGDCEDLSEYGLDVPYYVLKITDNNGAQTLTLGSKTPDGKSYYCMLGDRNDIFAIEMSSVTFTDDNIIKYMDTFIFAQMYTELKLAEVEITCGDVNENFTLGFDIWDDGEQLYFNGEPVADETQIIRAFRHVNTAIYSLDLVGIEDEPENKGERLISVKYTLSSGETVTVEGFRRDETTMYLYENGVYSGGYDHIRQITGNYDSYGIIGSVEYFRSISGMS